MTGALGWVVTMRDAKTAARVVAAVPGARHLRAVGKGAGRAGTRVDVGPDFEVVRVGVESVSVYYQLCSPDGRSVESGWVPQSYRYALDPTAVQERAFRSHTGGSRFAYNTMLNVIEARLDASSPDIARAVCLGASEDDARWAAARTHGVVWSFEALRREWNQLKPTLAPWSGVNSKEAYSHGLESLARAFSAFFASRSGERSGKRVGWPRHKSRSGRQSWSITTGAFGFDGYDHVRLPRIGSVRLHESARKLVRRLDAGTARITRLTVSWDGRHWQVSAQVMVRRATGAAAVPGHVGRYQGVCGVDLGVNHLATIATVDGWWIKIPNPRAYRTLETKLGRLQERLARQHRGSHRHRHTQTEIARVHARIAAVRREALHRLTTWLAQTFAVIVIEDLNVAGMVAAPAPKPAPDQPGAFLPNGAAAKGGLAKSVLDTGFGTIRTQLDYKTRWYGSQLIVHPRYQASTGVCSCSATTKLRLDERTWTCTACGRHHDRDISAAITLARHGHKQNQQDTQQLAGSRSESRNGRTPFHGPRQPNPVTRRCARPTNPDGTRTYYTTTAPSRWLDHPNGGTTGGTSYPMGERVAA